VHVVERLVEAPGLDHPLDLADLQVDLS